MNQTHLATTEYRRQRLWLLLMGALLAGLGIFAGYAPVSLLATTLFLLGIIVCLVGSLEILQWILGRVWTSSGKRGSGLVLGRGLLNIALGVIMLNHLKLSMRIVFLAVAAVFILEGTIQMICAMRMKHAPSRFWMIGSGLISIVVGSTGLLLPPGSTELFWVAILFATKLLVFAAMLIHVALFTPDQDIRDVFGNAPNPKIQPKPGEIYAVYYGPAFHCGLYVGEGQVVDYLNDNKVRQVSWEEFLLGRTGLHYEYPDLPQVSTTKVCRLARSLVGKEHPYRGMVFNCENFAIYCKSGGQAINSQYSQVTLGLATLSRYPFLGSVIEIITRLLGFLAYNMGGTFGKRAGFVLRWMCGRLTGWLVVRELNKTANKKA